MKHLLCVILVLMSAGGLFGAPADLVSANAERKPIEAKEWLSLVSQKAAAPVVLVGPLSGRRALYSFQDERLGDMLDDISGFYGYSWEQVGPALVFRSSQTKPGLPAKLAEWLDKRRQSLMVPVSLPEALILSTYPDDALAEIGRYCMTISINPAPYRVIRGLTPTQVAKAMKDGLEKKELDAAQVQNVEKLAKAKGVAGGWPDDLVLRYIQERDAQISSRTEIRLELSSPGGQDSGSHTILPLSSATYDDNDPVYSELPPAADKANIAPECKIERSGENLAATVRSAKLSLVLDHLSTATGSKLAAEATLEEVPVSIWSDGATVATISDALAAGVKGLWEDNPDGGRLLKRTEKATVPRENTPSLAEGLKTLFSFANEDAAGRMKVGACSPELRSVISSGSWQSWTIRLLQMTDPEAPSHADKPGKFQVAARMLSEEGVQYLLNLCKRTTYQSTGEPVYDRDMVLDPKTTVWFSWDGKGSYQLSVANPTAAAPSVGTDFNLDLVLHPRDSQVPTRWAEKPWFLKFPKEAPKQYLDYLERTRAWRGKLALKHIAPLAFLPESSWLSIRKKVPEFAVVTRENAHAIRYYAVFDHLYRESAQGPGLFHVKTSRDVVDAWLLGAVEVSSGLQLANKTASDVCRLKTQNGVADSLEFNLQNKPLVYKLPKASELLGQEGCTSK